MRRLIALLVALVACAPAGASTVSYGQFPEYSAVQFKAAPGEANDVTVALRGDRYLLTDGAGLTAGTGCTADSPERVSCPATQSLGVELGDGDDRFRALPDEPPAGALRTVLGGTGDDRLELDESGWRMLGGEGADTLLGGPGDDALDGGPGADRLDGREGIDGIVFGDTDDPVEVDLLAGTARWRGETDTLAGVEAVAGGGGADVIAGTDGPDELDGGGAPRGQQDVVYGRGGDDELGGIFGTGGRFYGGDGDDRLQASGGPRNELYGEAGDDTLDGSFGAETLDGGDGEDLLRAGEGFANRSFVGDVIRCGSGTDTVHGPGFVDRIHPDCEWVAPARTTALRLPRLLQRAGRGRVRTAVRAAGDYAAPSLSVSVALYASRRRRPGRLLGKSRRRAVTPTAFTRYTLRNLPPRTRRVQLVVRVRGPDGTRGYAVSMRVPRR